MRFKFWKKNRTTNYIRLDAIPVVTLQLTEGEFTLGSMWEVPLNNGDIDVYETIAAMGNEMYTEGIATYKHTVHGDVKGHALLAKSLGVS